MILLSNNLVARKWAILLIPALLFVLSGCAGLAGEPRIVSTAALPTVTPTSPPDVGKPAAKVSLARGAEIFGGEQGCQACHGISGKGDGLVAAQLTCKLPDFTDPSTSRSNTITAWFAITTNGNNGSGGCLMPPWKGRLNEQQRWDVTSYIYNLHYTPEQISTGATIYAQQCAACHGESGAGKDNVPNIADPAYLIDKSDTDIWQLLTNGKPDGAHKFADQISENDRWSVIAYTRSLTWESASTTVAQATTPTPSITTTPAPDTPTVTISGKVTNKTPGAAPVAAGTSVTLRVVELAQGSAPRDIQTLEAKTAADGSFSFGEQPRHLNMIYVATVNYQGILQTSTPLRLAPSAGSTLDLSFDIYDVTNDSTAVKVDVMRMFVSPFSSSAVLVQQGMSFTNTSGKMLMTDRGSVAIALPSNASNVKISEQVQQAFTVDQNNIIRGTQPLYPGADHALALQVSYLLPYENIVQLPLPSTYPIEALSVHVPQISGFVVQGGEFVVGDPLELQDGVYNTFNSQNPIPAGQPLLLTIRTADTGSERRNTLAIVLFIAGVVLLAAIAAVWRLNQQDS